MSEHDYPNFSTKSKKLRKKKKDKRKEQYDLRGKYSSQGERQKINNLTSKLKISPC